jgi:hypothetical protein
MTSFFDEDSLDIILFVSSRYIVSKASLRMRNVKGKFSKGIGRNSKVSM